MTNLQIKRAVSTASRLTYTPLIGELIYDIEQSKVYVGDGSTVGGVLASGVDTSDQVLLDTSKGGAEDAAMSSHFRQLAGVQSNDRNYTGFQLSSMTVPGGAEDATWTHGLFSGRFVGGFRCVGGIHVPRYSVMKGGLIRWEIYGEHLAIQRNDQSFVCLLTNALPLTGPSILFRDQTWNTTTPALDPAPTMGPFHIQLDMIPCGQYKSMLKLSYTAGPNAENQRTRMFVTTPGLTSGTAGLIEGDLDAQYKVAEVDFTTLPNAGDTIRISDGNKDSAESGRPFVFGGTGDYVNVGMSGNSADQASYFKRAVEENSPMLRCEQDGNVVKLYPFLGGESPYGHAQATITAEYDSTTTFTVTDFTTANDSTKTDWSTDQDFFLSLQANGMQSVVYSVHAFQMGVTKGWEYPVR